VNGRKVAGFALYFLGIALGIARPPVERLACMKLPSGEVSKGINTPLLLIEVSLIMVGALFVGLGHRFKNRHELNGWLGVATGLGIAFVGGYARITELFAFGVVLTTLGLFVYKIGGREDAR